VASYMAIVTFAELFMGGAGLFVERIGYVV
jgi:hypothetical protein